MPRLSLVENKDDAKTVLLFPEIFDTISEDGMEDFDLPDGVIYLCGYSPELMGCFVIHKTSKISANVHVQVLKKYRDRSTEFGNAVIGWVWDNTDLLKMTAQIPVIYPNVKDFAIRMGFEIEGVNKQSFVKNDQLTDQWYMGLRR